MVIRFEGEALADEKAEHTWLVCEHFEADNNKALGP
jgi:hypothetical protein